MKPVKLVNPIATISILAIPQTQSTFWPPSVKFNSRTIFKQDVSIHMSMRDTAYSCGGNNGPSLNGLYSGAALPVPAWHDNEPAITSFFLPLVVLSAFVFLIPQALIQDCRE